MTDINDKLTQVIQSLQSATDEFVLIRLVNQHFETQHGEWKKYNNTTLTKYFETNPAFEFQKVSAGKHLVRCMANSSIQGEAVEPARKIVSETPEPVENGSSQGADNLPSAQVNTPPIEQENTPNSEQVDTKPSISTAPSPPQPTEPSPASHVASSPKEAVPTRSTSSSNRNTDPHANNQYSVDHEIQAMLDILREMIPEGSNSITFGEIFKSDKIQNTLESLSGTLKAAKRRTIVHYNSELLMQGFHDREIITVNQWNI